MSQNESDDSDGEGFIPNKMIIKQRETSQFKQDDNFNHFQAHYVIGETVIKKQPPECHLPITNINRQIFQIGNGTPVDIKGELPTASSLYLSENYQLVYSRFKKPFCEGTKAAFNNEIIIKSVRRAQHFRTLKNWRSDNDSIYETSEKLKLDSKFEGGNLLCAFKSTHQIDTYYIFMQNDTNTYGYNQWFYFSVRQAKPNKKYTFRIVNFKKNYSFFKKGMQPYIFSLQETRTGNCGWYMGGSQFEYYRSNFTEKQSGTYYTLSFQIQFKHDNDFIMISSSLPYSYSKLIQQINTYQTIATQRALNFQIKSASKTLGGNQVPYIIITKPSPIKKKIILITARQHSGETWSSYLMDQILKGIVLQEDSYYQWLIDNFDFHIYPMINVDGVIYGNFRCDLAGYDLNRCWKDPSPILQPHIYRIRQNIQFLTENFCLHLYIDLHTHSKQHGFFAFCCVQSPECRKFPLLISSLTPLFRYSACTFGITAQKKTTARSQIFQLSRNINTITVELSAFGFRHPKNNGLLPFSIQNIKAIGQAIMNSIYYNDNSSIKTIPVNSYIPQTCYYAVKQSFEEDKEEAVSGSDSEPQIDSIQQSIKMKKILKELRTIDTKIKKTKPKIKKLKTQMNMTTSSPEPNDIDSVRFSPVNRYRAITETEKQKKDIEEQTQSRRLLSSTCVPQRTVHSFEKMFKSSKLAIPSLIDPQLDKSVTHHFLHPPKPLNLLQFSLKKLPIYNCDKSALALPVPSEKVEKSYISSLSVPKNTISVQEKISSKNNVVTFYRTKKESNISLTTHYNNNNSSETNKRSKDPYQFLCIMSESKKLEQIQRIKQRRQMAHQNSNKIINRTKFALIKQSTVLQRYSRNKKNDNSDVISKIWIKNFNRYSKSLEDDLE